MIRHWSGLGIEFQAFVDKIDNKTEVAYTAWPDRLYLIDNRGQVAFKSEAGPFGSKTELLAKTLESHRQGARPYPKRGLLLRYIACLEQITILVNLQISWW